MTDAKKPHIFQVLIGFLTLLVIGYFGLNMLVDAIKKDGYNMKDSPFDSSRAEKIKNALAPVAKGLVLAEKTGDKQAVLPLMQQATVYLDEFNALDEKAKQEINATNLRYCYLGLVHLANGASEVANSGYWSSKSQYEGALDECS